MDAITYKRNDKALHLPSGRTVKTWQCAKDGSWVLVYFDGVTHGKKVPGTELRPIPPPKPEPDRPTVVLVDRQEFQRTRCLCDDCRYATALMCSYLGFKDINKGLAVVGAKAVVCQLSGAKNFSYKIVSCPNHARGALASPRQVWPRQ